MEADLSHFHFLRPVWLAALPLGLVLLALWRHEHDSNRQWQGVIAPGLLQYLMVRPGRGRGLRPIHGVALMLALGAIAAAGPTWRQDRPPFLQNRAPLILAVDLSPSMDAADVPPSRLQAVKNKMHDLVKRNPGSKFGLLAYTGSAHMVLPPTDDAGLLDLFIQALSTDLTGAPGKNVAAVIAQAQLLLRAQDATGSLVLFTDGADNSQNARITQQLQGSPLQVLVVAAGSANGGMLRDAQGRPRTDTNGRPLLGSFDGDSLKALAHAADAPLGSLTLNTDDLAWIELHAQRHFESVQDSDPAVRWKDMGYWLCWPLLAVALLCVRRGWSVAWTAGLFFSSALGLVPAPVQAASPASAFFTPDQQGRWAFEHGRYAEAAARFDDAYWKGRAAYEAADFDMALEAFARLDTPEAYFYLGNTYARQHVYPQALSAYDQALRLRPVFPQASFNRALVARLQADFEQAQQAEPSEKADKLVFDNKQNKGKRGKLDVTMAGSTELWLRNLTTSPADFLRRKFSFDDMQAGTPRSSPGAVEAPSGSGGPANSMAAPGEPGS
jgi:Ca-activated chloride channel family protein